MRLLLSRKLLSFFLVDKFINLIGGRGCLIEVEGGGLLII